MIDVLIAGAGPVGLATALYAEAAGLQVTVVDPRSGPIDKACGEGLMPSAVSALESLGVSLEGQAFRGIRYTNGKRQAQAFFASSPGLGVRRTDLQEALHKRVRDRGIEVLDRSVTTVEQGSHSIHAAGLSARYLVAADGLHSPIRRELGLEIPRPASRRPRWGQRQHFAVAPWTDLVEVHWSGDSEAYVTPVSETVIGVAVLSTERRSFTDHLSAFPAIAERLTGDPVSEVRGAGPLWQGASARVSGRVLLVGDASGYVDALTGEGIAVGLGSAKALVECLRSGNSQHYEDAWRRSSRRYRLITETLLWAARTPPVRRSIVPLASAVPAVFGVVVRQLAH